MPMSPLSFPGSSTTREYIQRLGRVLRPKPGHAHLYEIVSRGTSEVKTARRAASRWKRRRGNACAAYRSHEHSWPFAWKNSRKPRAKARAAAFPASVYPHQLKDKKAIARLEIAIRTFDGSVGKRRRDMDAQAMTDFFGDPRLARGIVACLGQFYQVRDAGLPADRRAGRRGASARGGSARPADVRAYTYAHVNEQHHGFLTEAELADLLRGARRAVLPDRASVGHAAASGRGRQSEF